MRKIMYKAEGDPGGSSPYWNQGYFIEFRTTIKNAVSSPIAGYVSRTEYNYITEAIIQDEQGNVRLININLISFVEEES